MARQQTPWIKVHLLLKNLTNGHNKHSTTLKVTNYENIKAYNLPKHVQNLFNIDL